MSIYFYGSTPYKTIFAQFCFFVLETLILLSDLNVHLHFFKTKFSCIAHGLVKSNIYFYCNSGLVETLTLMHIS